MTEHPQYVTVRNDRGQEMLDLVRRRLEITETTTSGNRSASVMQTLESGEKSVRGEFRDPLPSWIGTLLSRILSWLGPKGMEFARYSIDYHYLRNFLYIHRHWKEERVEQHVPKYVRSIVSEYEPKISKMVKDAHSGRNECADT